MKCNISDFLLMAAISFLIIALMIICGGCSGTGFEKKTTLVPDSVTVGVMQERFKGENDAWKGISISGTWTFR